MDVNHERDPVEVLATEFLDRQRLGELPTISEYVELHPEHADEIRELFPTIAAMEQWKSRNRPSSSAPGTWKKLDIEYLGDFHILGEIGRGGMGIVYEAEQQALSRRVAVKILPQQMLLEEKHLRRFKREAKMAARLHHTNIVPVFGVGEQDGLHYYVMQLIPGISLDKILTEMRNATFGKNQDASSEGPDTFGPSAAAHALLSGRFPQFRKSADSSAGLQASEAGTDQNATATFTDRPAANGSLHVTKLDHEHVTTASSVQAAAPEAPTGQCNPVSLPKRDHRYWRSVAWMGVQMADALHYAHLQGTVHRDVKPGNVLLDRHGVAWLTDFGLARDWESDNVSRTGEVAGTLLYLAPEQLEGKPGNKSDTYSLGATLYEMLTLRPAFTETNHAQVMQKILHGDFRRPSAIDPHVPRDLETIVLKAMNRDPAQRYDSAGELRDDLERFMEDRPIRARRATKMETFSRWCRRNPTVAALTAATLLLLAAVAAVSTVAYFNTKQSQMQLETANNSLATANDKLGTANNSLETAVKARDDQITAKEEQRSRAQRTSNLAQEALNKIFDRFALDRIRPTSDVTIEGDEGEAVEIPSPPVLSKEDAALLEELLTFYEKLAKESEDDDALRRRVAQANRRVGDIRQRLGEDNRAAEAYRRALTLFEALRQAAPKDVVLLREIAGIHNQLGNVLGSREQRADQRKAYETALALLKPVGGDASADPGLRFELARTHYLLSRSRSRSFGNDPGRRRSPGRGGRDRDRNGGGRGGRPGDEGQDGERPSTGGPSGARPGSGGSSGGRPGFGGAGGGRPVFGGGRPFRPPREGVDHRLEAIKILEVLTKNRPKEPDYRFLLALCYRDGPRWGRDFKPILDDAKKATELLDALVQEHPSDPEYRHELIRTYASVDPRPPFFSNFSSFSKEWVEVVEAQLAKALVISDKLVLEHPNVPDYSNSHVHVLLKIARIQGSEAAEAEKHYRRALKMQRSLVRRFPKAAHYKFWVGMIEESLAAALIKQKKWKDAVPLLESAIAQREKGGRSQRYSFGLDRSYDKLAKALEGLGEKDKAAEAKKKAEERRPPRRAPRNPRGLD